MTTSNSPLAAAIDPVITLRVGDVAPVSTMFTISLLGRHMSSCTAFRALPVASACAEGPHLGSVSFSGCNTNDDECTAATITATIDVAGSYKLCILLGDLLTWAEVPNSTLSIGSRCVPFALSLDLSVLYLVRDVVRNTACG